VITYLVIKYREVKFKLRQAELEEQLEIRTKEVTEQKDKVMSINKDITDSINYAKRIQDAVLPDDKKFEEKFPKSFVIYKPRDIVSGDFYWTNSTTDKLLLGCGDCTGHGVPGAFMSLLGQQMLKEIYSIKHIESPDDILHELNLEIRKLMSEDSADLEEYLMVDGMDIIITEFDFDKMILKWSSAIRPLLRYRNGERDYLKGSRVSIGSAVASSVFELNTEKLEKGDMIYVFSDGFPDQFGGPNHKKLKTSGMFKILDEAHKMPITEQKSFIEGKLNSWMQDTEQTDDIIIIGVQV
jgi:serine phosphatase RsbU (regulator of sigma subunit)